MSWSPWLYSLPPVGPDRTPPLHGPGGEGSAEAWAMPPGGAGHTACARPPGPVPWAGWGYFWDQAGALGLVSDVPV